jgi:hypothetical protein
MSFRHALAQGTFKVGEVAATARVYSVLDVGDTVDAFGGASWVGGFCDVSTRRRCNNGISQRKRIADSNGL